MTPREVVRALQWEEFEAGLVALLETTGVLEDAAMPAFLVAQHLRGALQLWLRTTRDRDLRDGRNTPAGEGEHGATA